MRRPDPHDSCAIDVAEFEQLRGEIDNRTQITNALVAVELTALGVGTASISALPEAAMGLAAASIFLWMLWIDQASQIWKVAAYIAIELAPRLREAHPDALGWEAFVRRLDRGGDSAREALRIGDTTWSSPPPKTATVGLYNSMLLGGAPLALLALSISGLSEDLSSVARTARGLALFGSGLLWCAAFHMYRRFRSFRSVIDLAIERCASPPGSTEGAKDP